jgi:hypothetical protein
MLAPSASLPITLARGLAGALIGSVCAYFAFFWAASQGFYVLALPGALVGLGCGWATGKVSRLAGVMAGLVAFAVCVFIEWKFAPFRADDGFAYFVSHLHQKPPFKLLMIVLGTAFGSWFGQGRNRTSAGGTDATLHTDDRLR